MSGIEVTSLYLSEVANRLDHVLFNELVKTLGFTHTALKIGSYNKIVSMISRNQGYCSSCGLTIMLERSGY